MKKEFLETGKIVSTHGLHGDVKILPWADSPDFLLEFDRVFVGKKEYAVEDAHVQKTCVLMKLEGIDTVEAASAMRNKRLYMRRSDARLPDGVYFIEELIGCDVFDADDTDKRYGKISDVSETGANDVWHIAADSEKEYLIPAIPSVVINTDVKENKVLIRPMKGIFDDEN